MHLYHPSGRYSFLAVRELVQLMPCAVVLEDADTFEVLAFSELAADLLRIDRSGYFRTADFCDDPMVNRRVLSNAERDPNGLNRELMAIRDSHGRPFEAMINSRLLTLAGRRVMLSTIEPVVDSLPMTERVPLSDRMTLGPVEPDAWYFCI